MTKEELKQEAEEKLSQAELDYCHELSNPCEPSELPYSELLRFETGYKRGYLAGAEPREKRIAKLEAQIEKMKCCENCQHWEGREPIPSLAEEGYYCFNDYPFECKRWELAEELKEIKENDNSSCWKRD